MGLVVSYSNNKVLIVFFLCSVCQPSYEMQIFLLLPLRVNFYLHSRDCVVYFLSRRYTVKSSLSGKASLIGYKHADK